MKKTSNFIEAVKKILSEKGVAERKYASTIAAILEIHYNSAKQKLDGKRGITIDEMNTIFHYFNERFLNTKSHNCVFIMNNIHKRCNVQVEKTTSDIKKENPEHYAIQKDGVYIIDTNNGINSDDTYKVKSIEFLPEPEIAILDNDNDILNLIKKITGRYGIKSSTFNTVRELETSEKFNNYDAYIFDWQLDFGETPEDLIKMIKAETQSPIIILTGQLDNNEKIIGEMIMNYDIHLIEKPTKPLILSSLLLSKLFFN